MYSTVLAIVLACCAACGVAFLVNQVVLARRRGNSSAVRKVAPESMLGLATEAIGIGLMLGLERRPQTDVWSLYFAAILAPASAATVFAALKHLGSQWRIQAVVTDDHRLVTSGPYAFLRHPIYGALLGLAMSLGVLVSGWRATLIGAAVYIAGTEIRIRAEDMLLSSRFGSEFDEYRRRVKAYIPFVR